MKTPLFPTAIAGLTVVASLVLVGCTETAQNQNATSTHENAPSTTGPTSEVIAAFAACLTSKGVNALISESGQVMVHHGVQGSEKPGEPTDVTDSQISDPDSGDNTVTSVMIGEEGQIWSAPSSAEVLKNTPDVYDAYAACQAAHPDFTQPEVVVDPGFEDEIEDSIQREAEALLEFTQCARAEGFTTIADPGPIAINSLMVPGDMTEAEFRAMFEACYDPDTGFAIDASAEMGWDPIDIVDEFHGFHELDGFQEVDGFHEVPAP